MRTTPLRRDGSSRTRRPTRDMIFDTAVELFSRRGFQQVSIREITRAVGIKESSFYNHFRSKNALLDAIFDFFLETYASLAVPDRELEEKAGAVPPKTFLETAFTLFRAQMETTVLEKVYRVLTTEQFTNPRAGRIVVERLLREPIKTYAGVFRAMLAKGRLRPCSPEALASLYHSALFALVHEYSLVKAAGEDTAPVTDRIHAHIQLFVDSFCVVGRP